ncbi:hypothetical protein ACS2Q5_34600, partial [Bacillus cereus group sp. Bce022]|uniref:hypothetical protein n=1 Tax=Bacillus cereus group sp. Bce022 TaxID=3445244 RepID=UPI003F280E7E
MAPLGVGATFAGVQLCDVRAFAGARYAGGPRAGGAAASAFELWGAGLFDGHRGGLAVALPFHAAAAGAGEPDAG